MPKVFDEAICLRQWEWSETSQTVSLFTHARGLLRALAKGSRRPKAPFSGGVELLTLGQAGLIIRPSSDLALLTEWDLRETFPVLRADLRAHHAALYMAEVVQHVVNDHDPHPRLFEAMLGALRRLSAPVPGALAGALIDFQWSAIVETGYKPELEVDVRTGRPITLEPGLAFSPALGGLLQSTEGGAWPTRPETVRVLQALSPGSGKPGPVGDADPNTSERANRLLAAYLRHIIGRQPRTLALVFGDDLPV